MIRRQTWIVLVLFTALTGYFLYLRNEKKTSSAEATPQAEAAFVIDSTEGLPSSIEVKSAESGIVKLAKTGNGWAITLPANAEANQGLAEAAATQVTSLKVIDQVSGEPAIFGIDKPAYVITVELGPGKEHVLEVGDNTPSNSGYYVRVDGDKIVIVGTSGIEGLTLLLTSPPYLNTATPSPLPPTATPVPPTDAATPVTPTP